MVTECPKCGSKAAWYTKTHCDLLLNCLCGLSKVVYTTLEKATILHSDAGADVKLPKTGTNLRKTLMVLASESEATSAEITQRLNRMGEKFTSSDVASYLTILRSKGVVEATVIRRGIAGGSTWRLTETAITLLGL